MSEVSEGTPRSVKLVNNLKNAIAALERSTAPNARGSAPAHLDCRFRHCAEGELSAGALSDVTQSEETTDDEWEKAKVSPDGSIKLVKARSTGKALRAKIKLMGVAWEFVQLRFPVRA